MNDLGRSFINCLERLSTEGVLYLILEAGIAKHCLGSKIVDMHACNFNNEIMYLPMRQRSNQRVNTHINK